MGRKASGANQGCLEPQVHLVFEGTWEIRASKVKTGPLLLDPQDYLGLLEWMAREESQETLLLETQDPLGIGVFQEHQA